MTIIAVTGHRPEKIKYPDYVKEKLRSNFSNHVHKVISGMASGVDLWAAEVAEELGLELVCARPWAGHAPRVADKEAYQKALDYACLVVDVDGSDKYPGPWVYQKRNEWMINHSDEALAFWDGTSGGTANCVAYARKVGRPLTVIDPNCNLRV